MSDNNEVRILTTPQGAMNLRNEMSRRGFLMVSAGAGMAAFLAACGSSSKSAATTTGGSTTSGAGVSSTSAASTSAAPTAAPVAGAKTFNLYTWAEYDDPALMESFGNITIDIFNSNEEAVAKLAGAKGTSGYDMVVPTGGYIPQMAAAGLLETLDLSRIPNFKNLDVAYTNQAWDQGNTYSVCKNFGTTGWIYDTQIVTTEIKTWNDFITACQTVAKGNCSVLDTAPNLCGVYFWANGINWTTEKADELDACEKFIVEKLAPNLKAFDSYPGINLTKGDYAISQVWNGDARQGLLKLAEAGKDPKRYKWGMGAPKTEIFMDNWCIVKGAKNLDASYNFMNFILDPVNSAKDVAFHGYNTGLVGIEKLVPKTVTLQDMIWITADQQKQLETGAVNSAQDRLVAIYNKAKAAAGK